MDVNHNDVADYLVDRLKNNPKGNPIYYTDVIRKFNLPSFEDLPWSAHPLKTIFDAIDRDDMLYKRPFRTSVVISKDLNQPGNGFFTALQDLKDKQDPNTKRAREAIWIEELKAAQEYPW